MIFLNHCGVAKMIPEAKDAATAMLDKQASLGALMYRDWRDPIDDYKAAGARLLKTEATNVSYVRHTSEGLSLIAAGYPFQSGDEILSYVHEYPANHYPWKLQESRGVKLIEIPNRPYTENAPFNLMPGSFTLSDIERLITPRTRVIALSHVQFTSGFAIDLKALGQLCRDRKIDLVIDAAQSLGCVPIHPEEMNIAAVASSGWKWLMGPVGTGILYTSPEFRDKIKITMAGADLMKQGMNYLDHTWNPFTDARKFEYSTHDYTGTAALAACLSRAADIKPEVILPRVHKLHQMLVSSIKESLYEAIQFPEANRSGILSLVPRSKSADEVGKLMADKGFVVSPRAGFLRIAPHYHTSDEEIQGAAQALNEI